MGQEQYTTDKKGIFTAKRLKIGAAILVVCAIAAAGGVWYYHQQKAERHAQLLQAQTRMVEYQAGQRQISLLDVSQIKAIAAQAVGRREAASRLIQRQMPRQPA